MDFGAIVENLSWIDQVATGVWIGLTVVMLYVLYRVYRDRGSKDGNIYFGIFLLVAVYAYPFYTGFFQFQTIAWIGNVVTFLITLIHAIRLRKLSVPLSWCMSPQLAWLFVATVYLSLKMIEA